MVSAAQTREMINEEINKLREKETTTASLNAISNAVGKMISSAKAQLEYNKLTGKKKNKIGFLEE